MTLLRWSIWCFFLVPFQLPLWSQASIGLSSPEEFLSRASESQQSLQEVIAELEGKVLQINSEEVFDEYFSLLIPLKKLAEEFRLDEIDPQAVERLGARMADQGLQWLSIAHSSQDKLENYHRWMNFDLSMKYIGHVEVEVDALEKPEELQAAASNAEFLLGFCENRFPQYNHIQAAYRRIVSKMSLKYLNQKELAEEDLVKWISRLRTPADQQVYLEKLSADLINLRISEKMNLHRQALKLITLGQLYFAGAEAASEEFNQALSDTAIKAVLKFIQFEVAFQSNELSQLLLLMSESGLSALSKSWVTYPYAPSESYLEAYFEASQIYLDHIRPLGLAIESFELSSKIRQLTTPIFVRSEKLEGRYEFLDNDGKKWWMLLFEANGSQVRAMMWKEGEKEGRMFKNVRWDFESSYFTASEYGIEVNDYSAVRYVKFKPQDEERMAFHDPFVSVDRQDMMGKRSESFSRIFTEFSIPLNYEGLYSGEIEAGNGKKQIVHLKVSSIDGRYVGHLKSPSHEYFFELGNRVNSGAVYLTASSGSSLEEFAHLRFKAGVEGFKGVLILPGFGCLKVHLQK